MLKFKQFLEESAAWKRKEGKNPEGGLTRRWFEPQRHCFLSQRKPRFETIDGCDNTTFQTKSWKQSGQ